MTVLCENLVTHVRDMGGIFYESLSCRRCTSLLDLYNIKDDKGNLLLLFCLISWHSVYIETITGQKAVIKPRSR